MYFHNSPKIDY